MEKTNCPTCGAPLRRLHRTGWMRHVPGAKLYECHHCGVYRLMVCGVTIYKYKF